MTDPSTHLFWITSRAAGVTALILSSFAVLAGLGLAGKPLKLKRGPELRALHEALSLAALIAVAIHGLSLLADSYLRPGIVGIAVPFAGAYRPLWTGIGIVSGYGLAVLGLTYYARSRIGPARWRSVHRLTALFWVGGIVHSLGSGTDSGTWWFLGVTGIVVVPAAAMLIARHLPRSGRYTSLEDRSRPSRLAGEA
jgi:methionine sulfoxide reductase heme-binding subunit